MVGMDLDAKVGKKEQAEARKNFKIIEGSFDDIKSKNAPNPVLISADKAKYLNVKLHDALRVRFNDINGQQQAATLTIVAIMKPANLFMSAPVFLEIHNLKQLLGYGPHDIAQIYLRIKDPKKNAKLYADKLHAALTPGLAAIGSSVTTRDGKSVPVLVLSFQHRFRIARAFQQDAYSMLPAKTPQS